MVVDHSALAAERDELARALHRDGDVAIQHQVRNLARVAIRHKPKFAFLCGVRDSHRARVERPLVRLGHQHGVVEVLNQVD